MKKTSAQAHIPQWFNYAFRLQFKPLPALLLRLISISYLQDEFLEAVRGTRTVKAGNTLSILEDQHSRESATLKLIQRNG